MGNNISTIILTHNIMKHIKPLINLLLVCCILPLMFELIMFVVQTPMPRVEMFPLYIQPIIWGGILDVYAILIMLIIKYVVTD